MLTGTRTARRPDAAEWEEIPAKDRSDEWEELRNVEGAAAAARSYSAVLCAEEPRGYAGSFTSGAGNSAELFT